MNIAVHAAQYIITMVARISMLSYNEPYRHITMKLRVHSDYTVESLKKSTIVAIVLLLKYIIKLFNVNFTFIFTVSCHSLQSTITIDCCIDALAL